MRDAETPGQIVERSQVYDILVLQVKPELAVLVNSLIGDQAIDGHLLLGKKVQGPQ